MAIACSVLWGVSVEFAIVASVLPMAAPTWLGVLDGLARRGAARAPGA